MKKRIAMIAMMASLVTTTAFAEGVKIDGSIKSAETKTILAPYSGVVGNYTVTAGDAVNMGDALFALRTEQVYADFDGTVTAVFAQPGDSAASVEERYGALAYIEQDVLYRAECTHDRRRQRQRKQDDSRRRESIYPLDEQQRPRGRGTRHRRGGQELHAGGDESDGYAYERKHQGLSQRRTTPIPAVSARASFPALIHKA